MPVKTLDQEREAFEHWYSDEGKTLRAIKRSGDSYDYISTSQAWIAWQARAALDVPQESPSAEFGVNLKMVPLDPTWEMIEVIRIKYPSLFNAKQFAQDYRDVINAAPANSKGYQWVPIEPTPEMLKAVRWDEDAFGGKSAWPSNIYKAMLAAARNPVPTEE